MANHQNLLQADKLFSEKNFVDALQVLKLAIAEAVNDYWIDFLTGPIFEKLGFLHGANRYFLKSSESSDPAKVGAIAHYARNKILDDYFDIGELLDEALSLSAKITQKEYYFYKLLFMRGIVYAALQDFSKAEEYLKLAYQEQSYIPEELDFKNQTIRHVLDGVDLGRFPYLQYLRYRLNKDASPIVYAHELDNISRDAFAVEIGAMDGVRFDPLRKSITTKGWKALLIERAHEKVVEELVEGIRLEDLLSRHDVKKIDVLQIDTEGHDLNALKGVDLNRWKIPPIRIEIVNLLPPGRLQVFQILDRHGYLHYFDNSGVTAILPSHDFTGGAR